MCHFKACGRTVIGHSQKGRNEDLVLALPSRGLFAVADGMGGLPAGDIASALMMEALLGVPSGVPRPLPLAGAFLAANSRMREVSDERALPNWMGCTATALWLDVRSPYGQGAFVHSGDTRLIHWDGQSLLQITKDHTGLLASKNGEPPTAVVTQGIGPWVHTLQDIRKGRWLQLGQVLFLPGCWFLLVSDGFWGFVSPQETSEILRIGMTLEPECVVEALIAAALKNQPADNGDNISVVAVRRVM